MNPRRNKLLGWWILGAVLLAGCHEQSASPSGKAVKQNPTTISEQGSNIHLTASTPAWKRVRRESLAAREEELAEAHAEATATTETASTTEPTMEELSARLRRLTTAGGALTSDQAQELHEAIVQLSMRGEAALPTIQEFLRRNEDVRFDNPTSETVGYPSLRIAMVQALTEIGGPAATKVAAEAVTRTRDPLEIASLASMLEQNAPKQYRAKVLEAARDSLEQALHGNLPDRDVSPLFETLQSLGDASVVPVLKQSAAQWNYYATIALAGLPEGAGIPALIELARDPGVSALGTGDVALRPLAQVAITYPDAARALVEQARADQIPEAAWPTVIASLSGVNIEYGNGMFGGTAPPVRWTPDEVNQRIALLNQLLAVTKPPSDRQALHNAISTLSARLPK